jgi:hypothetical protein
MKFANFISIMGIVIFCVHFSRTESILSDQVGGAGNKAPIRGDTASLKCMKLRMVSDQNGNSKIPVLDFPYTGALSQINDSKISIFRDESLVQVQSLQGSKEPPYMAYGFPTLGSKPGIIDNQWRN